MGHSTVWIDDLVLSGKQAADGKSMPQGLKPGIDSIAFAARLKPCPFKTAVQQGFFRKL